MSQQDSVPLSKIKTFGQVSVTQNAVSLLKTFL